MITGDHPATAEAIAATISDARRAAGGHRRRTRPARRRRRSPSGWPTTDVVARCTPAHKVRIIQALQKCGRTVAMTGDGANDAPAIRLADVGIALGQRGTPAARAAADLVVTDDRLETIIATLVEGRAMWSSVRHALSILVGGNLGEIAFSVLDRRRDRPLRAQRPAAAAGQPAHRPGSGARHRGPPARVGPHRRACCAEGPDASLGETLTREIGLRAAATTLGADRRLDVGPVHRPPSAGRHGRAGLPGRHPTRPDRPGRRHQPRGAGVDGGVAGRCWSWWCRRRGSASSSAAPRSARSAGPSGPVRRSAPPSPMAR